MLKATLNLFLLLLEYYITCDNDYRSIDIIEKIISGNKSLNIYKFLILYLSNLNYILHSFKK